MQKISLPIHGIPAKAYFHLTKPGIIMGNLLTAAGGFALASRGMMNLWLFLATLAGLSLVIASACVVNNFIDRSADEKMARTKNRALVTGVISAKNALVFAVVLGLTGSLSLALFTNALTLSLALFGFIIYVIAYSFSKYRSVHATLIGSMAGAVPPVVGYCAVSCHLDPGALILFTMITFWQMPHFYAISIYRMEDYKAAAIPVLPIKRGMQATKVQMALYILAFMASSCMLAVLNYVGFSYFLISFVLGAWWLLLGLKGFKCSDDRVWARKMFIFSLVVVLGQFSVMPFSVL